MEIIKESTLNCPECKTSVTLKMPEDYCLYFYECQNCHNILKPKQGDCCVFCSYGDVPCPPVQERGDCC